MFVHAHTLYSSVRPFGVSCLIGSYGVEGPEMYVIDPSGVAFVSTQMLYLYNFLVMKQQLLQFFAIGNKK